MARQLRCLDDKIRAHSRTYCINYFACKLSSAITGEFGPIQPMDLRFDTCITLIVHAVNTPSVRLPSNFSKLKADNQYGAPEGEKLTCCWTDFVTEINV